MYVKKIEISGYKALRTFEAELDHHLNIFVGDNETGKSTLLEALNLVLSGQVNGRQLQYSLDPYFFNLPMVGEFFGEFRSGNNPPPPQILIEAFLAGDEAAELARLKGTNNSKGLDCPGIGLLVSLDREFEAEFYRYIKDPSCPDILPVEYYRVDWRAFSDVAVHGRNLPIHPTLIDTSRAGGNGGPDRYLGQIIRDCLGKEDQISLALSYRHLRTNFSGEDGIKKINNLLETKKGEITPKNLTISLDLSARSNWENAISAHLDEVPFGNVGQGEQSRVKMKLGIESAADSGVILVEEPENHLSHTSLAGLVHEIEHRGAGKQILISTHNSFILNKLGLNHIFLLSVNRIMKMKELSEDTQDYFMKLPGFDTLRLILAPRVILVEGPSDELIVQKAYLQEHQKMPIQDGVDVISVHALAFKRFLEIARLLDLDVAVVTDNDGSVQKLSEKYSDYLGSKAGRVRILFDPDEDFPTLEPQLLKSNSLEDLNSILGKKFQTDEELLKHMNGNKTKCALKIFSSKQIIGIPPYIKDAIK